MLGHLTRSIGLLKRTCLAAERRRKRGWQNKALVDGVLVIDLSNLWQGVSDGGGGLFYAEPATNSHPVSRCYIYSVKSQLGYRFRINTLISSSTIKSEITRLKKKVLFAKYIKCLHIRKILFFRCALLQSQGHLQIVNRWFLWSEAGHYLQPTDLFIWPVPYWLTSPVLWV